MHFRFCSILFRLFILLFRGFQVDAKTRALAERGQATQRILGGTMPRGLEMPHRPTHTGGYLSATVGCKVPHRGKP